MTRSHDADCARIADIDAEISKLEGLLRILRPERDIIWERLNQYPVLTLPNEIVSEIFLKFIPVYPSCSPLMGMHSPSHLMCICRQWRDIAQSIPQLWRALSTQAPNMHKRTEEKYLRLVKTWLIRSGSYPLSIQMGYYGIFRKDVFEAILPHSSRWEYITIFCDTVVPHVDSRAFPLLRQLDFRHYDRKTPIFTFRDAPWLRTATLWDCDYASGFLPWCQLTSLTLMYKSHAECAAILKETINLVHCRLCIIGNYDRGDVNLPRLETLALNSTHSGVTPYLGPFKFVVPSLHRLEVAQCFLRYDPSGELSSFIAKSGCKLQELCIISRSTTEDAYREALSFIPSLSFGTAFKWTDRE
ncbi:hypothetical protein GGX14DRAFT_576848 [Mycena pura]|uniref:F-box domain-containing protein n=1 Tax=Mycena pura TaxID=153505 RepID=A0AAD6USP9_9AGAR|nr:hypothetical protein GGX14DRAFT_576848 [Mycena pura]